MTLALQTFSAHPWAVQISDATVHHGSTGRTGAWGMAVVATGLAFVLLGVLPLVRVGLWRSRAAPSSGLVVDNMLGLGRRGQRVWLPVVRFDAGGRMVTSSIPSAPAQQSWSLDQRVEVLYDPADPRSARLARVAPKVSGWAIVGLGIVGVYLAVVT